MKKRILSVALCAVLITSSVATSVFSQDNGVFLTDASSAAVIKYTGSESAVTIPESIDEVGVIKAIGERAFADCTHVSDVVIPESVDVLGAYAFENCADLKTIVFPATLTSLGEGAFSCCTALRSFGNIPDGIERIEAKAFYHCSTMSKLIIPDSVTSIGELAFDGCASLMNLTLSGNLVELEYAAFYACPMRKLELPASLEKIGRLAFSECTGIRSLTIPGKVNSIEAGAFKNCNALRDLTVLEGVEYLGEGMFEGCTSLTTLTLPASLKRIMPGAFLHCDIKTIRYAGSAEDWAKIELNDAASEFADAEIEFDYHVHSPVHIDAVPATADSDGNIEHWMCSGCSKLFADANCTTELGAEDVIVHYEAEVILGDADGNGKINAKDITAILKYMVGRAPEHFVFDAADIDANGKINAKDVIGVLKLTAGIKE